MKARKVWICIYNHRHGTGVCDVVRRWYRFVASRDLLGREHPQL